MRRLIMVEPARVDIFFQLLLRKEQHFLRRVVLLEELFRHLIDALVRTLRGENDRDEQLVGRAEFQRGNGVRIQRFELR